MHITFPNKIRRLRQSCAIPFILHSRLYCGLYNYKGKPFELSRYVNQNAVFTSTKSIGGAAVRILERPGLWNGSMAYWITLIMEVNIASFTPVKTVLDLIRPGHQEKA